MRETRGGTGFPPLADRPVNFHLQVAASCMSSALSLSC